MHNVQRYRAVVLVLGVLLGDVSFVSADAAVYDKIRHMEDIKENVRKKWHNAKEILNQMRQIQNQVKSLMHQAQMIKYWTQDLRTLKYNNIDELLISMNKLESIVYRAEGLGYQLKGIKDQFTRLYPKFSSAAVSAKNYGKQFQQWIKQTRQGVQNAFQAHGIVQTNEDHEKTLTRLVTESQSSEGTLQALQVSNQISAVMVHQLNELKMLAAANGQAMASYIAQEEAVHDHGSA